MNEKRLKSENENVCGYKILTLPTIKGYRPARVRRDRIDVGESSGANHAHAPMLKSLRREFRQDCYFVDYNHIGSNETFILVRLGKVVRYCNWKKASKWTYDVAPVSVSTLVAQTVEVEVLGRSKSVNTIR
ncbi:hypothetical protein M9H77_03563 [Catharanthus roseus]|uniref:Uncharacterized protein n=1 Tax=Catharanthus roseus TaxID=4058 RepID=A0ACC0CBR7_CATRO|nr:hypothetical protein M9H77_03563 [Catharanthus roseus]